MTAKLSRRAETAVDKMVSELNKAEQREVDYINEAEVVFRELKETCNGDSKMTHDYAEVQEMEVEIQGAYARLSAFKAANAIIEMCWRNI
jgi:hypothetical protein